MPLFPYKWGLCNLSKLSTFASVKTNSKISTRIIINKVHVTKNYMVSNDVANSRGHTS